MSDGPVKMAPPGAPPLDDIILGDDDQTLAIPDRNERPTKDSDALAKAIEAGGIAEDRASQRPRDRSSNRVKAAEPAKDAKKRSKMTLRIPDDEVSRPQLPDARTPMGGVPEVSAHRPPSDPELEPLRPQRIISLDAPSPAPRDFSADDTLELPEREPRGPGVDR